MERLSPEHCAQLGKAALNAGAYDQAILWYEGCLTADDQHSRFVGAFNTAFCLDQMGRHAEAARWYRAAAEVYPEDSIPIRSCLRTAELGGDCSLVEWAKHELASLRPRTVDGRHSVASAVTDASASSAGASLGSPDLVAPEAVLELARPSPRVSESRSAYEHSERRGRCTSTAREWLDSGPVILDTETTGLESDDEIVQVAVVEPNGDPIYVSLVRPIKPIPEEATAVHHLTNEDVRGAPTGHQVLTELRRLLGSRVVCIYNAEFDVRLLAQTARKWGVAPLRFEARCVMKLHAEYAGRWNHSRHDWRWWKLSEAVRAYDLGIFHEHDALGDARMTASLLGHMAGRTWPARLESQRP